MWNVYISSAQSDLRNMRSAAVKAVVGVEGFTPLSWEGATAREEIAAAIRNSIDKADIVILIASKNLDRTEYTYAKELGKPALAFLRNKPVEQAALLAQLSANDLVTTFDSARQLQSRLTKILLNWKKTANTVLASERLPASFEVMFAPQLTQQQVTACLKALSDYFRACGGAGLRPDFELAEVLVEEPTNVLT